MAAPLHTIVLMTGASSSSWLSFSYGSHYSTIIVYHTVEPDPPSERGTNLPSKAGNIFIMDKIRFMSQCVLYQEFHDLNFVYLILDDVIPILLAAHIIGVKAISMRLQ